MSRVGNLPISLPDGVEIKVSDKNLVSVKGPKGELERSVDAAIKVNVNDGQVVIERSTEQKRHKALHGLYRALIANMVKGVSAGFSTQQELIGVGYRANVKGQLLELTLGYSHNVVIELPKEIKATAVSEKGKNPTVTLECSDNELLGMVASKIRSLRKPEPYKGKGIRFVGEHIRRKAGKAAGK